MGRQIVEMFTTRRIGIILNIFLVISLSVVALYPASPASAIPWSISIVDTIGINSGGDEGWNNSIAVDGSGNIHISYYYPTSGSSGELRYAKWSSPSGPWTITTVDSTAVNVGKYSSIALDSSGNPHISYRDATNNKIKYARWTGSSWSISDVDVLSPTSGQYLGNYGTSIAVDSSGNAHISYNLWRTSSRGDLKYAKWTGSSWYITLVESGGTNGTIGRYSAIALDSSGNPLISYYNSTSGYLGLKYAMWNPSHTPYPFDTMLVESGGGPYSSIAVDSGGNVHMSYYYLSSSMDLKYAKWPSPSGPWTKTQVDTAGNVGKYNSIAVDSNDNPHISYRDVTNTKLKYAMWTGSAWSIEDVDATADVGTLGAIALDSCNNPYISYYEYTNGGRIKCAIGTFHSKPTATASSNSPVFEGATIQLNGEPDSMISYNWYGPDGWTSTDQNPSRPNATTGMSGTYYLSVFDGTCTSDNVTTNVIVTLQPTQCVNTTTGAGTACFTTGNGSITGLTAADNTPCGTPPSLDFPYGFFSFIISNITPASTVTITITLPSDMPTSTQYWKCHNGTWINCTSLLGDNDGDNVLTLTLTDGGLGDADGVANGTIVDPGGPAIAAAIAAKPAAPRASPQMPTTQRLLNPAQMSVQYLSVNPQQAAVNQPVIISTNVVNTGDEAGNLNVTLKINSQVEQSRMVSVGPRGTQPLKFTLTKAQPGTYAVEIGGQTGSFTILGNGGNTSGTRASSGLIALIAMAVLILTTTVVLMMTFRRPA